VFFFQSVPVFAVISLIISFFLSAFFLMYLGAEFLAFVLLVVYIGALAVLFLFVVMLLDLRLFSFYSSIGQGKLILFEKRYIFFFSFLTFLLFFVSYLTDFKSFFFLSVLPSTFSYHYLYFDWILFFYSFSNIYVFGVLIYNFCFFPFILTGLLLLVALIAAINITLSLNDDKLIAQSSYIQVLRSSSLVLF